MKILMIGGTRFVGRHMIETALAHGHEVTMFNRGQHGAELLPQVERLQGDRLIDLTPLKNRSWDVAIDTSGYVPRAVRMSAELLAKTVEHYTFISTISVYKDTPPLNYTEDAPIWAEIDPAIEQITNETYGPLKVACERVAQEVLSDRLLIVRPGYVVGAHDHTDRFPYWVRRVAQGGEMLAPGDPNLPIQFVDARDLAEFTIKSAENKLLGTYHITGPRDRLSMGALLEECRKVTHSDTTFTWVSEKFLDDNKILPGPDLPLWIPATDADFMTANCAKAIGAGLNYRTLAATIQYTLDWDRSRPIDTQHPVGLKIDREIEALKAWQTQSKN